MKKYPIINEISKEPLSPKKHLFFKFKNVKVKIEIRIIFINKESKFKFKIPKKMIIE